MVVCQGFGIVAIDLRFGERRWVEFVVMNSGFEVFFLCFFVGRISFWKLKRG